MQNQRTLLIIDADAIAFICSKDTLEESLDSTDSLLSSIFSNTNATMYYLFLSETPYFRHKVNKEYKANRKSSTLLFVKDIKEYLKLKYNALVFPHLEADDLLAFVSLEIKKQYKEEIKIITASTDKDVFKQIPGEHYDYRNHIFLSTTEEAASYFLAIQTLTGDATDNIKGIPGIGPKKAEKILTEALPYSCALTVVYNYYVEYYGISVGSFEFQKNFRQVYLLRLPQDFLNEVGDIPNIPIATLL